ncbi:hypothetical protein [Leucobacter sp. cx-169]|uniref:hypothetical protein n=1 Tax=Leucobacter sp. cx-169 TaxID=2770549 RepID=UPI00165D5572|nr:hypothetical protein [Leucobacter sp. cx-169]MBC9927170.1 hypothetical protein [Leucobacter sp. cx-169]
MSVLTEGAPRINGVRVAGCGSNESERVMGHGLHSEFISIEGFSQERMAARNFLVDLVETAVSSWANNPDNDRGNPRQGKGLLTAPMTEEQAYRHVDSDAGMRDAFKHSTVTPVYSAADFDVKTRKLKVAVSSERIRYAQRGMNYAAIMGSSADVQMPPLADLVAKQHGITASELEIVSFPKARKPRASRTEGKTKTVYEIHANARYSIERLGAAATVAEATAAAVKLAQNNPVIGELTITARLVRGSDAERPEILVRVGSPLPDDGNIEVLVSTQTLKKGAKPQGWLVSFDYHS